LFSANFQIPSPAPFHPFVASLVQDGFHMDGSGSNGRRMHSGEYLGAFGAPQTSLAGGGAAGDGYVTTLYGVTQPPVVPGAAAGLPASKFAAGAAAAMWTPPAAAAGSGIDSFAPRSFASPPGLGANIAAAAAIAPAVSSSSSSSAAAAAASALQRQQASPEPSDEHVMRDFLNTLDC
jgi:hypothetical protein